MKEIVEKSLISESTMVEYKAKIHDPRKSAKTICSFVNTLGGTIFIGISDTKKSILIDVPKEKELLYQALELITPYPEIEIDTVEINEKVVIQLKVYEGSNKPYFVQTDYGKMCSIRISDQSIKAPKRTVKLLAKTSDIILSDLDKRVLHFISKEKKISEQDLSRKINISRSRARQILSKLEQETMIHKLFHGNKARYVLFRYMAYENHSF